MKRMLLLVIISLLAGLNSYAKKRRICVTSLQAPFMVGMYMPLAKFKQMQASDFLIDYTNYSFSFQPICLGVTFNNKIGFELVYQPCITLGNGDRKKNFENLVMYEFGNKYFVSFPNYYVLTDNGVSPIHRVFFGIVYPKKMNHFLFQAKLGIGATSFYSKSTSLYLKEKNTNNNYRLTYSSPDHSVDRFTITASSYVGFHLSKSVLAGANLSLSRFKPIINYSETITDLYTEKETIISATTYHSSIWNAGINIGITFYINKADRKNKKDRKDSRSRK